MIRLTDYNTKTGVVFSVLLDEKWRTLPSDGIIDACAIFGWITMVEWEEHE